MGIKLYIKAFFVYGLMSVILFVLLTLLDIKKVNFETRVYLVVTVWITTTISCTAYQIKSVQLIKNSKLTTKDLSVFQQDFVNKSIEDEYIVRLLMLDKITRNWNFKIKNSLIKGRSSFSFSSWGGEEITIKSLNGKIVIESRPVFPTAIFDNGKNLKNVQLIKKIIKNTY